MIPRNGALVADTVDGSSRYLPTAPFEYLYYAQAFYSIMGPVIGLSIGFLGIAMLGVLGGFCMLRMGKSVVAIVTPVAAPLACGVAFIAVQILAHGASLANPEVREFIPWMLGLVVLQWLALRRGFLHRFSIAFFLIGLLTLPFLKSFANDASRAGLDSRITIGNPNDLGAWFGFCFVYFTVLGLETRRNLLRAAAWLLAVFCLLIVGLTVSRAPLLAAACSVGFAGRRVLKRGFFPFLCLVIVAWVAYGFGVFERAASMYGERGLEETGRALVWPLAIARFLEVPFQGVGANNILTYIPSAGIAIAPHNALIFIALASGVVPLVFFSIYWVQLFIEVFRVETTANEDNPFQIALLIYAFLIVMNLNGAFMLPWVMATLATITGKVFVRQVRRRADARLRAGQSPRQHIVPALARRSRA